MNVDLPYLNSLTIGYKSFENVQTVNFSGNQIEEHSEEIDLPSLSHFKIGNYCFYNTKSFSLTSIVQKQMYFIDIPNLELAEFGFHSFKNLSSLVLESNTSLNITM